MTKFCAIVFFSFLTAFFVFTIAAVFVPTTKEMALIKVAPALARSELVRETIPAEVSDIYRLAKEALVEKIKGK